MNINPIWQYLTVSFSCMLLIFASTSGFVVKEMAVHLGENDVTGDVSQISSNHVMKDTGGYDVNGGMETLRGKDEGIQGLENDDVDTFLSGLTNGEEDHGEDGHEQISVIAQRNMVKRSSFCTDPSDEELEKQLLVAKLFKDLSTIRPQDLGEKLYANDGNTCSRKTPSVSSPINERSMCPWSYIYTESRDDRYPKMIQYSVCNCTSCGDSGSSCEPVRVTQTVLVKEEGSRDENGKCQYKPQRINVPQACVCSRATSS